MNKYLNSLTIFIIISLFLVTGLLFWYGQNQIELARDIKSTILSWENLTDTITTPLNGNNSDNGDNENNLSLNLQNLNSQEITCQISFILNDEVVDSQEITLSSRKKKRIEPTEKVMETFSSLLQNSPSGKILYQLKITWGKEKEILGKWLRLVR